MSTAVASGSGAPKIERFDVFPIAIPVRRVRKHGSGDIEGRIRNVLVKITAEGLEGWGEASPWPVFTGTAEATITAVESYLAPALIGFGVDQVHGIIEKMDRTVVGHTEVKAAIEMAILDILGKYRNCPVSDLIGGRVRDGAPLSVSLADPAIEADLDFARMLYDDGIRIFKIKTGFLEHRQELTRLERLIKSLPDDVRWRVDYNQGLAPLTAKQVLPDLDIFGFDFIEQPVRSQEIEVMADLRRRLKTPIQADESVFSPADAYRVCVAGAADVVSIKVMKSGGIIRGQQVAAVCAAAGVANYGGDMFETGLAHAAGMHLVATTPNITEGCEFYHAKYHLSEEILSVRFPVNGGYAQVPMGPGLGVTVDEEKVRWLMK